MMADASSACLALLRFYDSEAYDASRITNAIRTYAETLNVLFTAGRAHTIKNTYTYRMVEHLRRTRTFVIGQSSITIGSAATLLSLYTDLECRVSLRELCRVGKLSDNARDKSADGGDG